jgi:hypothetical protein
VPDEIEVLRAFRDETPGPSTDAWARAKTAIAAAQAEESPAVRRRVRGPRRRRWLPAASLVASAAVVAALLALLLPGSPTSQRPQIATDAYVTHVENALTSANQDNLISYARSQYPAGTYLTPVDSSTGVGFRMGHQKEPGGLDVSSMVRWAYHGVSTFTVVAADGRAVFAQRVQTSAHSQGNSTAVFYTDGTWWRMTLSAMSPGQSQTACGPTIQLGAVGWVGYIRTELSCGELTPAGRQQVDGVDAIKFTGQHDGPTLWVNPATYLPVRLKTDAGIAFQTDFGWLSPTVARLDQLNLTVPAHFRRVAAPS